MSHPDQDLLADLALGEPVASEFQEHVVGCPTCGAELAVLRTTLALVRDPRPELVVAPAGLWDRVLADTQVEGSSVSRPTPEPLDPSRRDVADVAPVFGAPDQLAERRSRPGRRRVGLTWVAGAAAAGLVFGAVGSRVLGEGETRPPSQTVVASTPLDTLDTAKELGSASLVERAGSVDLDVRTQTLRPDGGYLEVWLINRDLKRMVSIGVLSPEKADQSFTISPELITQGYVIVDISREGFDDKPQHSGDSLVRGTLPA
ncbi:MAG: anti-sigma factor [Ornithinibacter sp.]